MCAAQASSHSFSHADAAGHHGEFLAGLELPGHWFDGAGPHLAVVAAAGVAQAPGGAGGGREPVQIPGSGAVAAGGVFGQGREQPQAPGAGAGEVLFADVPGAGEHGAQPQCANYPPNL